MRYFYGIFDQAAINAFILYTFNITNKEKRYTFIEQLSLSLIKPFLAIRLRTTLRLRIRLFIESIMTSDIPKDDNPRNYLRDNIMEIRKRCAFCPYSIHRKTQYKCLRCHSTMCVEHTARICYVCSLNAE
jgi:hypothetical protein